MGTPTANARPPEPRRRRLNPIDVDPSRTFALRKKAVADTDRRFRALEKAIVDLVGKEDVFGLGGGTSPTGNSRWAFTTTPEKLGLFQTWLSGQVSAGILEAKTGPDGPEPWQAPYVKSAHQKGVARAYADANKASLNANPIAYKGGYSQFVQDAFSSPVMTSKVAMIVQRDYTQLKGMTDAMSQQLGLTMGEAISRGWGSEKTARELVKKVSISKQRARTIARTEIIHAHAEGQLDSFELLGIDDIAVMAEWTTAGDGGVCPLCQPLNGAVMKVSEARGLIPRHPNCRCAWQPANIGESPAKQIWGKDRKKAFADSVAAEGAKGADPVEVRAKSRWKGADSRLSDNPEGSQYAAVKLGQAQSDAKRLAMAEKALAEQQAAEAAAAKAAADLLEKKTQTAINLGLGLDAGDIADDGISPNVSGYKKWFAGVGLTEQQIADAMPTIQTWIDAPTGDMSKTVTQMVNYVNATKAQVKAAAEKKALLDKYDLVEADLFEVSDGTQSFTTGKLKKLAADFAYDVENGSPQYQKMWGRLLNAEDWKAQLQVIESSQAAAWAAKQSIAEAAKQASIATAKKYGVSVDDLLYVPNEKAYVVSSTMLQDMATSQGVALDSDLFNALVLEPIDVVDAGLTAAKAKIIAVQKATAEAAQQVAEAATKSVSTKVADEFTAAKLKFYKYKGAGITSKGTLNKPALTAVVKGQNLGTDFEESEALKKALKTATNATEQVMAVEKAAIDWASTQGVTNPVPAAVVVEAVRPAGAPDPTKLTFVRSLPGSTRPNLMRDESTGKLWVVKSGLNPEHLKSEALADDLYRIMGAKVPASGIIETRDGPLKYAEFIPDGQTLDKVTKAEFNAVREELKKHFVADALLSNYDVAGLSLDNIYVAGGVGYRIDNGGAMLFRAQGGAKAFGVEVTELKTLLDPKINASTAKVFAGISDDEIRTQVDAIVLKRERILSAIPDTDLRDKMAKRIDWLQDTYGTKVVEAPRPALGKRAAAYTVDEKTVERIRDARANGLTIAGDRGSIEDVGVLVWEETDANGNAVTKFWLKATQKGSDDIIQTLGIKAAVGSSSAPNDGYASTWVEMAKTLNTHQADKAFNQSKVTAFLNNFNNLKNYQPDDPVEVAKKAHYLALGEQLKAAHTALLDSQPATIPFATAFDPSTVAVKQAAKPTVKTVTKPLTFQQATATDGRLTRNTSVTAISGTSAHHADFDGAAVKFVPVMDGRNSRSGLAFEGLVEITVDGPASVDTVSRGLATLREIGIDTRPPTPAYEEALYLHRGVYLRGEADSQSYKQIWENQTLADDAKVVAMKSWIKENMGIDVEKIGDAYNPTGVTKTSFGHGQRYWTRWDLPPEKAASELKDLRLVHTSGGLYSGNIDALKASLEGVLQTGGEFTSTLDRVRKGVSLSAGASSQTDITTGGASYFFTRIRKADKTSGAGVAWVFKPELLSRQDAVSYSGDSFGRISGFGSRASTVDEYRSYASSSSNETIFKGGISVLDDLEYIQVENETQKKAVVAIFKKNKLAKLPDGRKAEDVVKVIK